MVLHLFYMLDLLGGEFCMCIAMVVSFLYMH